MQPPFNPGDPESDAAPGHSARVVPLRAGEEGAAPQPPAAGSAIGGGELAAAVVAGLMVITRGMRDIVELALLIGVFLLAGQGLAQLVQLLR
jgi:hypothetical protein